LLRRWRHVSEGGGRGRPPPLLRSRDRPGTGGVRRAGARDRADERRPGDNGRRPDDPGLDVDDRAFAAFVMSTRNDPRGWGGDGSVAFARTDGEADIRVVLATPATVDEMCAPLATDGRWSCGRYGHAAPNADRSVLGADA